MIGKGIEAYWKSVNEAGGINGRKVNFITLDDGYNPAKCIEVVRRLVEQDKVLCCFNTLGTPSNTAIQKYMNAKKVPQLFVASGSWKWGKPEELGIDSWQAELRCLLDNSANGHPDLRLTHRLEGRVPPLLLPSHGPEHPKLHRRGVHN